MISISEIMTTGLYTLEEDACLLDLHNLMRTRNIRHVPVVSSGELLGIVSHRDLLSATPVSLENQKSIYSNTRVRDIMRTGVETIAPSTNVRAAALTLERHKIGCLPVVENNQLCGIVTSSDFVAMAVNLLEQFEMSEEFD
jgi:CBS domain-containing protein